MRHKNPSSDLKKVLEKAEHYKGAGYDTPQIAQIVNKQYKHYTNGFLRVVLEFMDYYSSKIENDDKLLVCSEFVYDCYKNCGDNNFKIDRNPRFYDCREVNTREFRKLGGTQSTTTIEITPAMAHWTTTISVAEQALISSMRQSKDKNIKEKQQNIKNNYMLKMDEVFHEMDRKSKLLLKNNLDYIDNTDLQNEFNLIIKHFVIKRELEKENYNKNIETLYDNIQEKIQKIQKIITAKTLHHSPSLKLIGEIKTNH